MADIVLPAGSGSAELQTAINGASFGDVIWLSGDMPFADTVTVRQGLEITLRSPAADGMWTMYQYSPGKRHFVIDGSLILEHVVVDGRGNGGGVQLNRGAFCLQHGATVQNCTGQNGGGVFVVAGVFSIYSGDYSTGLPLKGGEVINNSAENGGGIYMTAGYLNISSSTAVIGWNKAGTNGGGVYVNSGTFSLSGGDMVANEAGRGGGIYVNSGTFNCSRGEISGNKAADSGGGIYLAAAAMLAINSTTPIGISGNIALNGDGGGIYTENVTYSNMSINSVEFICNIAAAAHTPPEDAGTLYPNIQFSAVTIAGHPLNNYDICHTAGAPFSAAHKVSYNANGGSGGCDGPDVNPCETHLVMTPEDAGVSRDGYVFTCWNTSADGSGENHNPGEDILLNDDMTLYAQWERHHYSIIYNANCGCGTYVDTCIRGGRYTVLSLKETGICRKRCVFTGWNTCPCGRGKTYCPGDRMTVNSDVILFAQWC